MTITLPDIGGRFRSTKKDIAELRLQIKAIVRDQHPITVRQVYYQATVYSYVPKDENGYRKVQRTVNDMREDGSMPYSWIVDNTRYRSLATTYIDPASALEDLADNYRMDLWYNTKAYVGIWLEKDALRAVVNPVTDKYAVSLMVSRGYPSTSFVYEAAMSLKRIDRPTFIYYFGDHDPSGMNAAKTTAEKLRRYAPDADIHFEWMAVTPQQIEELRLPTRPTKKTDSRSATFAEESVELDSIPAPTLRRIVESCIQRHMPDEEYLARLEEGQEEKAQLRDMIGSLE